MKVIFENTCTATFIYEEKKQTDVRGTEGESKGKLFKKIGESSTQLSSGDRLKRIALLFAKLVLGLFLVPIIFGSYRESVKTLAAEIWTGRERVVHCIPWQGITPQQGRVLDLLFKTLKRHNLLNPDFFQQGSSVVGVEAEDQKNPPSFEAAKCFVKLESEKNQLKLEFFLKDQGGAHLHAPFLDEEIGLIKQKLSTQLDESFGELKEKMCSMFVTFKTTQGKYAYESVKISMNETDAVGMMIRDFTARSIKSIIEEMGFVLGDHLPNGEFVAGQKSQQLYKQCKEAPII